MIKQAVNFINKQINKEFKADIAFVLGSGLSYLSESMTNKIIIKTSEIPNYPISTVLGHKGEFIFGFIKNIPILILSGRVHYYEGYTMQDVVFPIKILSELGIKNLILTNAAGGINPKFKPGDLMLITDYVNNMFTNPLIGQNADILEQTNEVIMSKNLNVKIEKAAKDIKLNLHKGTYIAMSGPSFETPAEVRFLATIGGDAVGMSTVPEIIEANNLNIEVAGISCITNYASGISKTKLTHKEVSETAIKIKEEFSNLLKTIIKLGSTSND